VSKPRGHFSIFLEDGYDHLIPVDLKLGLFAFSGLDLIVFFVCIGLALGVLTFKMAFIAFVNRRSWHFHRADKRKTE